jgi:TRAP-type C4-dicarboxylate transport system permease small subunit
MSKWLRLEKYLSSLLKNIGTICLVSCVGIGFINVVFRYALRSPLRWGEEVTLLLLIGCVYLPQMENELTGGQLNVTLIQSKRFGWVLEMIVSGITVALLASIARVGWRIIVRNYEMGTFTYVIGLPMWVIYGVLELMIVLMILASVTRAVRTFLYKADLEVQEHGK